MVSSSGASNESNSNKEVMIMDLRKKKRMLSNRESARRSRQRKQKHLDELNAQVTQLRKENSQIVNALNITTQHYFSVEAENSVLKTQMIELSNRLQALNEILACMNRSEAVDDDGMRPWSLPLMPCSDMFQYC